MPARVRVTANFEANLNSIRDFLVFVAAPAEFERLLGRLFDEIIPNLARFPDLGRDFAARAPQSTEGAAALAALRRKAGGDTTLREYITDDYLLLYAARDNTVFLLSIRHHRQLSFDLRDHWR
jgi:plasmid stabilization system protein ParE